MIHDQHRNGHGQTGGSGYHGHINALGQQFRLAQCVRGQRHGLKGHNHAEDCAQQAQERGDGGDDGQRSDILSQLENLSLTCILNVLFENFHRRMQLFNASFKNVRYRAIVLPAILDRLFPVLPGLTEHFHETGKE